MRGSFDYTRVRGFYTKLQAKSERFNSWLRRYLEGEARRLLVNLESRTPVGETGKLKDSWFVQVINKSRNTLTIIAMNSMYYAQYVEIGFSYQSDGRTFWREGVHMLQISLLEMRRQMPRRYNAELAAYLSGTGLS